MQRHNSFASIAELPKVPGILVEKNATRADKLTNDLVPIGTSTHPRITLTIFQNQNDEPNQPIQNHRCF